MGPFFKNQPMHQKENSERHYPEILEASLKSLTRILRHSLTEDLKSNLTRFGNGGIGINKILAHRRKNNQAYEALVEELLARGDLVFYSRWVDLIISSTLRSDKELDVLISGLSRGAAAFLGVDAEEANKDIEVSYRALPALMIIRLMELTHVT